MMPEERRATNQQHKQEERWNKERLEIEKVIKNNVRGEA
jgi:hypothetical protein